MKMIIKTNMNHKMFDNIKKQTATMVREEIDDTVERIADAARVDVPVDTGFLKGSIITAKTVNGGKVIVNANYAPYVEFGTGGKVDVPKGLERYAIQFKGKGIKQVNLPARPFLYPNWKRETIKMLERIRNQIGDGAKS